MTKQEHIKNLRRTINNLEMEDALLEQRKGEITRLKFEYTKLLGRVEASPMIKSKKRGLSKDRLAKEKARLTK
jgi:hypothetical protein